MRAKFDVPEQTHATRFTRAKFRLDRFVLSPLAVINPKFAVFWTSAFCGVASWWQSKKVEDECTTTTLALSNGIKIVSVL